MAGQGWAVVPMVAGVAVEWEAVVVDLEVVMMAVAARVQAVQERAEAATAVAVAVMVMVAAASVAGLALEEVCLAAYEVASAAVGMAWVAQAGMAVGSLEDAWEWCQTMGFRTTRDGLSQRSLECTSPRTGGKLSLQGTRHGNASSPVRQMYVHSIRRHSHAELSTQASWLRSGSACSAAMEARPLRRRQNHRPGASRRALSTRSMRGVKRGASVWAWFVKVAGGAVGEGPGQGLPREGSQMRRGKALHALMRDAGQIGEMCATDAAAVAFECVRPPCYSTSPPSPPPRGASVRRG